MNENDFTNLAKSVALAALRQLAGRNNAHQAAALRKSAAELTAEIERRDRLDTARCVFCWEFNETNREGACRECAEENAAEANREEAKGAYAS